MILNPTDGFGWPRNAYDFLKVKGYLKESESNSYQYLEYPDLEIERLSGLSALLTFPGALTYGHWIVDIWGRVEILKRSGVFHKIENFIFPAPLSRWMYSFINFFEIDASRVLTVDKLTGYSCENLLVPTVPSQTRGGVLPYDLSLQQFPTRARLLREWLPTSTKPKAGPLFLKHRHLTSNRSRALLNADQVGNLAVKMGGRVVDPVLAPIGEVISAINDASIVVGQDSSALHNVAFVGKPLLVIETEKRNNLLHVSIQDAMGARIGYAESALSESGWQVDVEMIEDVIGRSNV